MFVRLILLCAGLVLAACQPLLERSAQVFAPASQPSPEYLVDYLAAADQALAADHLSEPQGNNALALYRQALLLEPGNEHARQGLALICQRYAGLANAALSRGEYRHAADLLDEALQVDPHNGPLINLRQALAQQEQLALTQAAARIWDIDKQRLARRDARLGTQLRKLADDLVRSGDRIAIYSRTEAEARWIFEQLRRAQPGYHFVVTTGLSARPRIVRAPVARQA